MSWTGAFGLTLRTICNNSRIDVAIESSYFRGLGPLRSGNTTEWDDTPRNPQSTPVLLIFATASRASSPSIISIQGPKS